MGNYPNQTALRTKYVNSHRELYRKSLIIIYTLYFLHYLYMLNCRHCIVALIRVWQQVSKVASPPSDPEQVRSIVRRNISGVRRRFRGRVNPGGTGTDAGRQRPNSPAPKERQGRLTTGAVEQTTVMPRNWT